MKIHIIKDNEKIKILNNGLLIIEGKSYNDIISTINKTRKIIQDDYQLNLLESILYQVREKEVA